MDLRRGSLVLATLAAGLSAGFFVTYAISVTRGLARVDDETYVQTMQSINDTVRTGWFAAFFFGSLPLLILAAILAATTAVRLVLAGAAVLYAAGVLGVTFLANVPMNEDLAEQTGRSAVALAAARTDFEDPWNAWNLVRTLAALLVFAVAAIATSAGKHPATTASASRTELAAVRRAAPRGPASVLQQRSQDTSARRRKPRRAGGRAVLAPRRAVLALAHPLPLVFGVWLVTTRMAPTSAWVASNRLPDRCRRVASCVPSQANGSFGMASVDVRSSATP